jgi:2-oxoglutarate dehydrogenase E1 component
MELFDFFSRANADYLEQLYEQYRQDPTKIDERWAVFFAGFEAGNTPGTENVLARLLSSRSGSPAEGVNHLVHSFRQMGHLEANLNPLGEDRPPSQFLRLSEFGFSEDDKSMEVAAAGFYGPAHKNLGELIDNLRATYCGNIGVEFMGISDKVQREWLLQQMEPLLNRPQYSTDEKKQILEQLVRTEGFEQFLHTKYVGQKRFSVQGADSVIPLLQTLVQQASREGADEIIMGMAHRGRLNVLAHVLGKPYEMILCEFEGTALTPNEEGDGDVKYHMGYTNTREGFEGRPIQISLCPNPSHLELVNPVLEGMVKAKQEARGDDDGTKVVPIIIHGEAAFTGQGIVPETLSLSELDAYRTGGTVHIIVNNQVGFTATASQTRFTPYPTDVAKMIQAPIFHVNGDDPEAVVHVARVAMQYRQQFKMDVMIDVWCYRKYGHNETDDPTFTQPVMYQKVAQMKPVRETYAATLLEQSTISAADIEEMETRLKSELDTAWTNARDTRARSRINNFRDLWEGFDRARDDWSARTAVSFEDIQQITEFGTLVPDGFSVHPKLQRLLETRKSMARGEKPADWGCGEMWALGSLLMEGTPVRLVGQDCERGTFSHRHAVLHDYQDGREYAPLSAIPSRFTIKNSMLSELAVMGFEYGYSVADPRNLVIWEAQFGDFVNGAQPIIDQFLSSGESKWDRMSGLVLLLPHGYEGQGPEHSSARLERFLQLCAENNMQVCYPSVPAQYFHMLRRQIHRNFRKPLVLMMPKSLLRDERSTSAVEDFTKSGLQLVIPDAAANADAVERILFCSGKIYFPIDSARQEQNVKNVAVVRVEQLYPFPEKEIQSVLSKYKNAAEIFWVQEEPKNMGAWSFISPRIERILPAGKTLEYRGRGEASSPAHGFYRVHNVEEQELIKSALDFSSAGWTKTRTATEKQL